jgi:hypothetical protein
MCSAISMGACFTFLPGNEFGFLHGAFEEFVVQDWKGLSLERAARPIHRIPARRFSVNPKQEIELVLRVLSTQPTDEDNFHLEHEDVNPRKVEQEPEEEPEEAPEEEPEERPEEEPEEEPVPLPVPVGGTLSSLTAQSVSFKKFRTHETTSSARRPADIKDLGLSPYYRWLVEILTENIHADSSTSDSYVTGGPPGAAACFHIPSAEPTASPLRRHAI